MRQNAPEPPAKCSGARRERPPGGPENPASARIKAVTAAWHGGAWGEPDVPEGGAPAEAYPTPPGTPPVWSDQNGGAKVNRTADKAAEEAGLAQAWSVAGR